MAESVEKKKNKPWWGDFSLKENQCARWELGPTTVWLSSQASEWRVAYWTTKGEYPKTAKVTLSASERSMESAIDKNDKLANVSRYIFKKSATQLNVKPLLADRAVIVRPETPFFVFPKEEITLYIASPAWIRFEAGVLKKTLIEIPSLRPSDTWFGPSTLLGELCYSLRTLARLQFEPLTDIAYRIITPVRVRNRADDILELDRFQVLVKYLPIYESNGVLWTPTVTIEREKSGGLAAMQIAKDAPKEATKANLVQQPREKPHSNLIFRAFGGLFD